MERKVCAECNKRRYKKYMQSVYLLKTERTLSYHRPYWICKPCAPKVVQRLALQVRKLKGIIDNLTSAEVDK